eukprot:TRINITY_DN29325_c0_g1_i1.p1 TRINITY_DN29325_c0_g1~~TRINITY_DN29325_c0_g1_i1.p1  ORF type:complete len:147 (+),score=8.99 TRINITY_DN29325_c0_g1_i1:39-443(+)
MEGLIPDPYSWQGSQGSVVGPSTPAAPVAAPLRCNMEEGPRLVGFSITSGQGRHEPSCSPQKLPAVRQPLQSVTNVKTSRITVKDYVYANRRATRKPSLEKQRSIYTYPTATPSIPPNPLEQSIPKMNLMSQLE